MSINEHRIDDRKVDFAPAKGGAKPFSRRSDDNVMHDNIEDNFISNAKVVEIDVNEARIQSKIFPFVLPRSNLNVTRDNAARKDRN